ncbi:hybrid sensor histidine kinase/response regulator [Maricaulis sp.]|uniref:hybrid sensor histidine kinase/response regulator n=1 Tax=Maricaulis sp. TaxID=1486257 RepID=UPI003A9525EE
MLIVIVLANTTLLLVSGAGRPGMALLGIVAMGTVLTSIIVGTWLRRPEVTMALLAVFSILLFAAAIYGNRGSVPPVFAYLPCLILGFHQFWGGRSLLVALPAVSLAFAAVFYLAGIHDPPDGNSIITLGVALALSCVWLTCLATVFRSVQELAAKRLLEANDSLTAALDDSRSAQRSKSEFLANVGHEVRTPLNGVLGMADVMHRVGRLPPDQAERLDLIRESGATLLELLNEILDQSKIETGQIVPEQVDFDLGLLIEKSAASWRPEAESRGLDLHVFRTGLEQSTVKGDSLRIRQILNNLISNALKFTDAGHIALHVDQSWCEQGQVWNTVIHVTDTGAGIRADKHDSIFEAFHQADASITRRYGGTGLGLSISRQLARLMDGDLRVTSSPGAGSCFSLSLPLAAGERVPLAQPESPGAPRLRTTDQPVRILSVDDVATNHIVLRALLEQALGDAPLSIESANSGAEAIEAVRDQTFDLIFMDIQMPEMDGATAASLIRKTTTGRSAWIVAVSALEASQSANLVPAGLFQGILPKPTSVSALQKVLVDWQQAEVQLSGRADERAADT